MIVAPIAGVLSDRIGARPLMAAGLALQGAGAGVAGVGHHARRRRTASSSPAFVMAGTGMALVFAPAANAVLGVRAPRAGRPGVGRDERDPRGRRRPRRRVLATVFSAHGGYASPQAFTDGLVPAVWVGAAVLFAGRWSRCSCPARRRKGPGVWDERLGISWDAERSRMETPRDRRVLDQASDLMRELLDALAKATGHVRRQDTGVCPARRLGPGASDMRHSSRTHCYIAQRNSFNPVP